MMRPSDGAREAEALRRAGEVARHGSTRARAGRFEKTDELRAVAQSVHRYALAAMAAWKQWEAINRLCQREYSYDEVQRLAGLGTLRGALLRDALLGCGRLTDSHDTDKDHRDARTLTRIAAALDDPGTWSRVTSEDWARDIGYRDQMLESAPARNTERARRIVSLVVPHWNDKKRPPVDPTLLKLRERFYPIRNRILTHAGDDEGVEHMMIGEIGELIHLTLDLATDAAILFNGAAVNREATLELLTDQASDFWAGAMRGVLDGR